MIDTKINISDLKKIGYEKALNLQLDLNKNSITTRGTNSDPVDLLLLEHQPPVITIGRRGSDSDILLARPLIEKMGIEIFESARGGEVTYHGPGQLVGYCIMNLDRPGRSVRQHIHNLEEIIIQLLKKYEIDAHRSEGFTGVWIGNEKIAAIGVAVKKWCTYHGFALNINTNMDHFNLIVPCGIRDKGVTSMQKILGKEISIQNVKKEIAELFKSVYKF